MKRLAATVWLAVSIGCVPGGDGLFSGAGGAAGVPAREFTYMPPSAEAAEESSLPPLETADELGPKDPRVSAPYRIRPGDVLELAVTGEEDTARRVVVGPDGRINYLAVEGLPAAGKTFSELRRDIAAALRRYYVDPQVEVSGADFSGNAVTVLGMVERPGRFRAAQPLRLLDALALAGGVRTTPPGPDLERAVLIRGGRVVPVDFKGLLEGTPRQILDNNVVVKPGDSIYIPARKGTESAALYSDNSASQ